MRQTATAIENLATDWNSARDLLNTGNSSVETHLQGQIATSFHTAARSVAEDTDAAVGSHQSVVDQLRGLASYIESKSSDYESLLRATESKTTPFETPLLHYRFDDPEVQLNNLVHEIRTRIANVSSEIRRQAENATEGGRIVGDSNNQALMEQILTFAITTAATAIVLVVAPEVVALLGGAEAAEGAVGARAAVSAGRALAAEEGISSAVIDAAATRAVVPIVADTGLPISSTFTADGYTFVTDGLGRVIRVSGELELAPGATVSRQTAAAIRQLGDGYNDQAGHMIAKIFNGPNDKFNLVPQNANLNQGAWRTMERGWADALKNGDQVSVKIRLTYEGTSARPVGFKVYSSTFSNSRYFENIPGGGL